MTSVDSNSKEVSFLYFAICVYFYFRIISYYSRSLIDERLLITVRIIICVYALIRIILNRKIQLVSFVGSAFLFWLISMFSNVFFPYTIGDTIVTVFTQSWWFLLLLCFLVIIKKVDDKLIHRIVVISYLFIFIYFFRFLVWFFSSNKYWSSGGLNTIYYPLLLLPFIYYSKKRLLRIITLIVSVIIVFFSAKRTAFFVLLAIIFVPVFISCNNGKRDNKKFLRAFLLLIVSILAYFLIDHISLLVEFRLFRRLSNLSEDGGSGRFIIYTQVWEAFKNTDLLHKLFGHGFNTVALSSGVSTSAHNDFLEIIYDYGIFALVLYVLFIISLFKHGILLYRDKSPHFSVYVTALVVFIIMSTSSHLIIYPTYIVFSMLIFALSMKPINIINDFNR